MLKVTIHSSTVDEHSLANQLAVLDIAYAKRGPLSNYLVALSMRNFGEAAPAIVENYPRWSASLWILVARAIAQALYRAKQFPSSGKPDHRCAYATNVCAVMERQTANDRGVILGTAEITQRDKRRGCYHVEFNEDILGPKSADFEFGYKALNPVELLGRAICWAYFHSDVLGPPTALIVPTPLKIDDVERFHVASLDEPAFTGFQRYCEARRIKLDSAAIRDMPRIEEYISFLKEG